MIFCFTRSRSGCSRTKSGWWYIIGPACHKYVRTATNFEVKMKNQVFLVFVCLSVSFFVVVNLGSYGPEMNHLSTLLHLMEHA